MRVLVFVEGPSDKLAMEALFEELLTIKASEGIAIEFFPVTRGDHKAQLLTELPKKAANIVIHEPGSVVAVVPDLYPKNKGFPHESVNEMIEGVMERFEDAIRSKGQRPADYQGRFRAFCFKHDMEALLLADEEALKAYLGAGSLKEKWTIPVEDQNFDLPPKRVIERLFNRRGKRYIDTIHAPSILRRNTVNVIADRCPQCFKPFAEFLVGLA